MKFTPSLWCRQLFPFLVQKEQMHASRLKVQEWTNTWVSFAPQTRGASNQNLMMFDGRRARGVSLFALNGKNEWRLIGEAAATQGDLLTDWLTVCCAISSVSSHAVINSVATQLTIPVPVRGAKAKAQWMVFYARFGQTRTWTQIL